MKINNQSRKHATAKKQSIPSLHSPLKWKNIGWKKAEKQVKCLQNRIFRMAKNQQWDKVRSLQKLLVKSYYNKVLAIREITQKREGKYTPGIDNIIYDTDEKREKLVQEPFDFRYHKPSPAKRIFIPKSDGSQRLLGIPTIKDRIMQTIVKTALEPEWESRFEPNNFGFRPNRSTMDAMTYIRKKLGWYNSNQWVLDADITKCFDNIKHEAILERIYGFKTIMSRWLKAGVVEFGEFSQTHTGTPQGGVLSPLLANIVLDGMEKLFKKYPNINLARFADDFVVIAPSKAILENYVLPKLKLFLSHRGLDINELKTAIVHRTEGFNFLGFTVRYFENRRIKRPILLIFPQKSKVSRFLKTIKKEFRTILHKPLEEVMMRLNLIIKGWTNYYRYSNAKRCFVSLSLRIWYIVWRRLKRLHKHKPAKWILKKYYQKVNNRNHQLVKGKLRLIDPSSIPIIRYSKKIPPNPYVV